MSKLALFGGSKTLTTPLKHWNTLNELESQACDRVIKSGVLSGFVGGWVDAFNGGPEVRAFEQQWAQYFQVKQAITVNSATSGLYAAIGAIGLNPGDEVIVPPLTMSATATAPLIYGGIPIFADICPNRFTLDIEDVRKKIAPKTKAILVVNLFGHPAHLIELKSLCEQHKLYLIEDNAQGPGAKIENKFAGTIGDMGIFSLNCHKHIQTGEGGVIVTNNDALAMRLKMIRNHAEAVVPGKGETNLVNMVGWNYRMTELEAAVGSVQLTKLNAIIKEKRNQAHQLHEQLKSLDHLTCPVESDKCESVYYTYPLKLNPEALGIDKEKIVQALAAEGVPVIANYVKPLYWAPLFAERTAFGNQNYPFSLAPNQKYQRGDCPVAERIQTKELFYIPWCSYQFTDEQINQVGQAFIKVWDHLNELKSS